jgi:hypothetical protein
MHGHLNFKFAVEHVFKKQYKYNIAENINQRTIILCGRLRTEH